MAKKLLSEMVKGSRGDLSEFSDRTIDILNQDKRLPVIVLVDTSASMSNYEALLKNSVENMYEKINSDADAEKATELCIMTFNSDIEILEKLREIKSHESQGKDLSFHCDGVTLSGLALKVAIAQLEDRVKTYKKNHKRYYSPILFFISDGRPECYDDAVKPHEAEAMNYSLNYIRNSVATDNMVVISVEVGNNCDHKLMAQITGLSDDRHVINVDNMNDFEKFFEFTSTIIIGSAKRRLTNLNEMSFKDRKWADIG